MVTSLFSCSITEVRSAASRMQNVLQRTIGDRRTPVPIDPSLVIEKEITYSGMRFSQAYVDLMLVILSLKLTKYFDEWSEYLQFDLEEYLQRNLLYPELRAMLVSTDIASYVVLSEFVPKYNEHAIFSLLADKKKVFTALESVRLRIIHPGKVVRPIRRRGYKDKGTLRRPDCVLERFDLDFILEQQRIEQQRREYLQEVDRIVNTVTGMVLDAHEDLKQK